MKNKHDCEPFNTCPECETEYKLKDEMIKDIIVFDLDGTLSIVGDRIKHLERNPKDWDSFYDDCKSDKLNIPVCEIYKALLKSAYTIEIVTGRRESVRGKTVEWFHENGLWLDNSCLHMRKTGDKRHDVYVKPELVEDFKDRILVIFEDRNSMVDKWRSLGYTCLQVGYGDF